MEQSSKLAWVGGAVGLIGVGSIARGDPLSLGLGTVLFGLGCACALRAHRLYKSER